MAKKNINAIVSGAGWIGSFAGQLIEDLEELGVSPEDIHKLGKPTKEGRALVRACAEKIVEQNLIQTRFYPVTVDYGKTVEEMVSAGHYIWENDNINSKNFPVKGKGTVNVNLELVHLNKLVSSEDVLAYLESNGMRPATVEELLAFGATYPEVQREFPIICLGSSWVDPDGDRGVPYLDRGGSRRDLCLGWFDDGWVEYCRFLAVRKDLSYSVVVDYGKTVEEMVLAGCYDGKDPNINSKNFPVKGKGKISVNLKLVHFSKVVSSEDVLAFLEKNGMRPAKVEELLAFGATYPEIQRAFPIVYLGSSWEHPHGFRRAPCLCRLGSERHLLLDWFDLDWTEHCRFLAVRK